MILLSPVSDLRTLLSRRLSFLPLRQPMMPFARKIFASSNSVALLPRERMQDMTALRSAFVKMSGIG
ncbi:MAG: hypothetical protein NTV93_04050 [Verrucomicrobia bacterium]|nr:hypothetical protein [Verrucomicrobiota bacterium]